MRINTESTASPSSKRDLSGAMTDISFLLIIFFIISAVFMTDRGILLKLPDPELPPKILTPEEVIRVEITAPGVYMVDDRMTLPAVLRSVLAGKASLLDEPIAVLTVGGDIPYQEVLSVLEEAKFAGCTGFSISTDLEYPLGLKIDPE